MCSDHPLCTTQLKFLLFSFGAKEAAAWEAHMQTRTFEMEDSKEGIAALLEKRAPKFNGR